MYHDRIDLKSAKPVTFATEAKPGAASVLMAVLIVLAMPVIAVGFLLNVFWRDLKAIGRAAALCVQTYAEEFARRR